MTTPEELAQWAKDAEWTVANGDQCTPQKRYDATRILALCKDVEDLTIKVAQVESERFAEPEGESEWDPAFCRACGWIDCECDDKSEVDQT